MSIVVGGGTGFLGRYIARLANNKGLKVINVSRKARPNCLTWDDISRAGLPNGCEAVISMSGEPVMQSFKRWDDELKEKIRESRVEKTKLLSQAISAAAKPPKVFVAFSGATKFCYYKPDAHKEYTEDDKVEPFDFLSEVTRDWEAAAVLPEGVKTRVVVLRSGLVLGDGEGVIGDIKKQFSLGLGGRIGSGKQWFPWIHVDDMVGIIMFALENDHCVGVINGTSPKPVTSEEFTRAYARALNRPHLVPMPAFVVKLIFGEAATFMLNCQKVMPKRVLEMGYKFKYPDIDVACKKIVG